MSPPACKVFRWIRKAGDVSICRKPRLDDDNDSIIVSTTNIEDTNITRLRHKLSHKKHETVERDIRKNKVSGDFTSSSSKIIKKHSSLPVPPRKPVPTEEGSSKRKYFEKVNVDTRRFCVVDPFDLGGHRRSYTLDTTWNITAFFDNTLDNDDESPATILIAKKENLSRNNRLSGHSIRSNNNIIINNIINNNINNNNNNNKRISITKEIIREVEIKTFRWESRRTYREKTCSQLYELYEKQINHHTFFLNNLQDKPLPPLPDDKDQNKNNFVNNNNNSSRSNSRIFDDLDPELQSLIDTISLISDYHDDVTFDESELCTPTSSARESFSELLITDEIMLNLLDDEEHSSRRNSISSFETLPVEVETCLSCKRKSMDSGYGTQWCKTCEMKKFEEQFESWSSGNDDIDCFILETQLTSLMGHLEWIPYDRFQDIVLISNNERKFKAIWLDGPRDRWDVKNNQHIGCGECLVVLKHFKIPQNPSSEFFDQLSKILRCENNIGKHIIRCYGITRDPKSEEYMLVLQYAEDGNISHYLKQNFSDITWRKRLDILYNLAEGLKIIHEKDLVHGNLHSGNVLLDDSLTLLSDLTISNHSYGTYGVLPYVAPEVLKNKPYTMASDIYSFGMIMWELITGRKPFANRSHDENLATEICKQGLRPEISSNVPECYINLLRQCWSSNQFKRPCANILRETIGEWIKEISSNFSTEISIQFQLAEEKRLENIIMAASPQLEKDDFQSETVYTRRLLNFEKLHEPNVIFTKSFNPKEHLALRQYINDETKYYDLKISSLKAESSDVAAEIYDILQYL